MTMFLFFVSSCRKLVSRNDLVLFCRPLSPDSDKFSVHSVLMSDTVVLKLLAVLLSDTFAREWQLCRPFLFFCQTLLPWNYMLFPQSRAFAWNGHVCGKEVMKSQQGGHAQICNKDCGQMTNCALIPRALWGVEAKLILLRKTSRG